MAFKHRVERSRIASQQLQRKPRPRNSSRASPDLGESVFTPFHLRLTKLGRGESIESRTGLGVLAIGLTAETSDRNVEPSAGSGSDILVQSNPMPKSVKIRLAATMMKDKYHAFFSATTYAVAGASTNQEKYGNKVFRALLASGRQVHPLNPSADLVEGQQAFPTIADLPTLPQSLSIVTPPEVTRQVVAEAIAAGVMHIWMQPGAEDEQASQSARDAGLTVIDDGSCILVLLARR